MNKMLSLLFFSFCVAGLVPFSSCTRNQIEFGTLTDESYTELLFVDTIGIEFSTVSYDSFVTNSATRLLAGHTNDPFLGNVSAAFFSQFGVPASLPTLTASDSFDSLVIIFRPDDYYYGDTSIAQSFTVYEVSEPMVVGYNSSLYNSSSFSTYPVALGQLNKLFSPVATDSLAIRLSDSRGEELYQLVSDYSSTVQSESEFTNYFKGIKIAVTGPDNAAICGFQGAAGMMVLRVYYHSNQPNPESKFLDFPSLANSVAFNQIVADRSGTGLNTGSGVNETYPASTGDRAFLQPGLGVYLKMRFPTLKTLLTDRPYLKLLKAELIIKPEPQSFDLYRFKLPGYLTLAYTDASNMFGDAIADSTGQAAEVAYPFTDPLYGENNFYRFNVTSTINQLLSITTQAGYGLMLLTSSVETSPDLSRLIINAARANANSSVLKLTFLNINP